MNMSEQAMRDRYDVKEWLELASLVNALELWKLATLAEHWRLNKRTEETA